MASRHPLQGSLSLVVVVLLICAFATHVDAKKCSKGWATCKTNVWSDVKNCGKCGVKCPRRPHATIKCSQLGGCSFECHTRNGWSDCDGRKNNGCEVNTKTDNKNCGTCGNVCSAGTSCVGGACVRSCPPSATDCSGKCVYLSGDVLNCGACGAACATDVDLDTTCEGGICLNFCNFRNPRCPGPCFDFLSDPDNCGACGNICPWPGQCEFGKCM